MNLEHSDWQILLIDEDEDDCLLTRVMLSEAQGRHIELDWAPSFNAGVEMMTKNQYDAVLVDYDLRPKKGIQLIRHFAERDYPSPMILYSGQALYETELEALRAGATAYLSKREATPLLLERLIRYAIERKRAEQELRISERTQRELAEHLAAEKSKLEAVLNNLPVGVWIIDAHGNITSKNTQADRVWGGDAPLLDLDEYQTYAAWWVDRDEQLKPEEYPAAQAVIKGEPSGPVEVRIRRFDGTPGRVLISAAPILDGAGNVTGAVAINLDITEQRQAQDAMEKAHAKAEEGRRMLEALLEHVPEGISIAGGPPDYRITHVSKWGSRITGRSREDLVDHPAGFHAEPWGLRMADGVTIPDPHQTPLYRASHFGEETSNMEMIVEAADGTRVPVLIKAAPIRDKQGQIVGSINCWLDITERKQAEALAALKVVEAEAAAREADLRRAEVDALFEQINEAVLLCDLEGVPQRVNPRVTEMYGFDPTGLTPEVIASRVRVVDRGGNSRQLESYLTELAQMGELVRNETLRIYNAAGGQFVVSASANPFYNTAGDIAGIVITWHDITEREQHAQNLRESEERFRLARQAVDGVVYDWNPRQDTVRQLDGVYEILGYPNHLPVPSDPAWWQNRIHPEDAPIARQQLEDALAGRIDGVNCEYRIQHLNGHYLHMWDRAFILHDENGRPVRVVGFAVDISERKAGEARALFLQQLGRDLNAVQRTDEAGSLVVERLGQFMEVDRCLIGEADLEENRIAIRYDYQREGYSVEGPTRINFDARAVKVIFNRDSLLAIEDAEKEPWLDEIYPSFLKPVQARSLVLVPLAVVDDLYWTLAVVCGEPHRWKEQDLHFLQQVGRLAWLAIERIDVSEKLQSSEERFRLALDQAPIGVFIQDRDLRYTWAYNPTVGMTSEDLIGRRDDELIPEEDVQELVAFKREVVEMGQPLQRELHMKIRGEEMDFVLNSRPVFDHRGQVIGLVSAVMDTTEIRKLRARQIENEARVQVQRWLMQHREKERMQIARTLHDKPLQDLLAAHLYMSAISDQLDGSPFETLKQAQRMLEGAIEEIRSLALELRPPMLMHMGLEKAMRAYANAFRQRYPSLLIHLDLEQDVRALSEDVRLALYRIFQELLINVMEHANAGEVHVTLRFQPEEIVMLVEDDGGGFETPQQWIDLASTGHMGLVGISERMEMLNGSFKIDSKPGTGTRVKVRVPVTSMSEDENRERLE